MTYFRGCALALTLVTSQAAFAQFPTEKGTDGWTSEIGLGIEHEPVFAGSKKTETQADPYINIAWRSGPNLAYFLGSDVGYLRDFGDRFRAGFSVGFEEGRDEDDDEVLRGLGDIDDTEEFRIDAVYGLSRDFSIGARAMTAGNGKDDVFFVAGIWRPQTRYDDLDLTVVVDASWGSAEHLQTEFGVTPAQSASSGYATYTPGSGLKSIGVSAKARWWLTENWFSWGEVAVEKYGDAGSDSPFVQDDTEFEIGLGVGYRF